MNAWTSHDRPWKLSQAAAGRPHSNEEFAAPGESGTRRFEAKLRYSTPRVILQRKVTEQHARPRAVGGNLRLEQVERFERPLVAQTLNEADADSAPYKSRLRSKMCVSMVVVPEASTVGRVPTLVTDGRTTPSRVTSVA